ncbi:hypothetical protein GAH_01162 [Geoglobus ahangari]|uniref:Uncharacterized protein n=1 Tax=Geoglobus ahangari TaxID=113653 RepID=A0A0F7IHQ2_9EURY|nr:hypothetical protein [Geoglobus ahangari]AKG91525.1 hypothetical protein GAH_01162 [Geoglobus ahangari]
MINNILQVLGRPDVAGMVGFYFGVVILVLALFVRDLDMSRPVKIASIILLVSLSLLAGDVTVYLAVIFIVATGVTKSDFLLKLAAILRGGEGAKSYFDYLKELPFSKNLLKPGVAALRNGRASLETIGMEEVVLRYLERKYGTIIKRMVNVGKTVLDGVMATERGVVLIEVLFDTTEEAVRDALDKLVKAASVYRAKSEGDVELLLVFGTEKKPSIDVKRLARNVEEEYGVKVSVEFAEVSKLIGG